MPPEAPFRIGTRVGRPAWFHTDAFATANLIRLWRVMLYVRLVRRLVPSWSVVANGLFFEDIRIRLTSFLPSRSPGVSRRTLRFAQPCEAPPSPDERRFLYEAS